jgi:putative tricarboxylic transport membrane protein
VFGGLLLLAGVVVVVDALRLPRTTAVIPPAAVPLPVGVLLGVVGVALVVRSRRALAGAAPGEPREPGGALRVFALVLAIVAFALLLPLLGYVVCSAALFSVAAMLLGAPRTWQTVAAGWALAALVFLVFDRLIGLTLPAGPWGF